VPKASRCSELLQCCARCSSSRAARALGLGLVSRLWRSARIGAPASTTIAGCDRHPKRSLRTVAAGPDDFKRRCSAASDCTRSLRLCRRAGGVEAMSKLHEAVLAAALPIVRPGHGGASGLAPTYMRCGVGSRLRDLGACAAVSRRPCRAASLLRLPRTCAVLTEACHRHGASLFNQYALLASGAGVDREFPQLHQHSASEQEQQQWSACRQPVAAGPSA